jgi:hypothetical protein
VGLVGVILGQVVMCHHENYGVDSCHVSHLFIGSRSAQQKTHIFLFLFLFLCVETLHVRALGWLASY